MEEYIYLIVLASSSSQSYHLQVTYQIYVDSWDTDPNEVTPFESAERKKNPRLRSYGTFRNLLQHLILNNCVVLPPTVHDYTMDRNADMPPDDREEDSLSAKRNPDQYYRL